MLVLHNLMVNIYNNLENLGKSLGSESTSYFTVCLSSGSGDIIGTIGGGTVAAINSLQGVIN